MDSSREKSIKVNFCLSSSTLEKVKQMAVDRDRSVSSLLRVLIDKAYLEPKEHAIW